VLDRRFVTGIGTGEALNQHVTTARWPNIDVLARYLAVRSAS
jgi:hypothetical protein